MFEHHRQPLLSRQAFVRRMYWFALWAVVLMGLSWFIGILGYRFLEDMPWIDAVLNAAMILGGMGPVNELHTESGKIFASLYALFSGAVFLIAVGVLLAPVIHRLMHQFHLKEYEDKE